MKKVIYVTEYFKCCTYAFDRFCFFICTIGNSYCVNNKINYVKSYYISLDEELGENYTLKNNDNDDYLITVCSLHSIHLFTILFIIKRLTTKLIDTLFACAFH